MDIHSSWFPIEIKDWKVSFKRIKCKVTNLPLALTKKGALCSTHIQFTWNDCTSFTNILKNPSGDVQCSKIDIAKLLPPLNPRVLLQLLHWKITQPQADKAEETSRSLLQVTRGSSSFLTKTPKLPPGSQSEQTYYVITPESLARQ